jgi:hypothetical protein
LRDFGQKREDYSRDLELAKSGPTVILRGNNPQDRMSALGQKQTSRHLQPMSALPPKADIGSVQRSNSGSLAIFAAIRRAFEEQ